MSNETVTDIVPNGSDSDSDSPEYVEVRPGPVWDTHGDHFEDYDPDVGRLIIEPLDDDISDIKPTRSTIVNGLKAPILKRIYYADDVVHQWVEKCYMAASDRRSFLDFIMSWDIGKLHVPSTRLWAEFENLLEDLSFLNFPIDSYAPMYEASDLVYFTWLLSRYLVFGGVDNEFQGTTTFKFGDFGDDIVFAENSPVLNGLWEAWKEAGKLHLNSVIRLETYLGATLVPNALRCNNSYIDKFHVRDAVAKLYCNFEFYVAPNDTCKEFRVISVRLSGKVYTVGIMSNIPLKVKPHMVSCHKPTIMLTGIYRDVIAAPVTTTRFNAWGNSRARIGSIVGDWADRVRSTGRSVWDKAKTVPGSTLSLTFTAPRLVWDATWGKIRERMCARYLWFWLIILSLTSVTAILAFTAFSGLFYAKFQSAVKRVNEKIKKKAKFEAREREEIKSFQFNKVLCMTENTVYSVAGLCSIIGVLEIRRNFGWLRQLATTVMYTKGEITDMTIGSVNYYVVPHDGSALMYVCCGECVRKIEKSIIDNPSVDSDVLKYLYFENCTSDNGGSKPTGCCKCSKEFCYEVQDVGLSLWGRLKNYFRDPANFRNFVLCSLLLIMAICIVYRKKLWKTFKQYSGIKFESRKESLTEEGVMPGATEEDFEGTKEKGTNVGKRNNTQQYQPAHKRQQKEQTGAKVDNHPGIPSTSDPGYDPATENEVEPQWEIDHDALERERERWRLDAENAFLDKMYGPEPGWFVDDTRSWYDQMEYMASNALRERKDKDEAVGDLVYYPTKQETDEFVAYLIRKYYNVARNRGKSCPVSVAEKRKAVVNPVVPASPSNTAKRAGKKELHASNGMKAVSVAVDPKKKVKPTNNIGDPKVKGKKDKSVKESVMGDSKVLDIKTYLHAVVPVYFKTGENQFEYCQSATRSSNMWLLNTHSLKNHPGGLFIYKTTSVEIPKTLQLTSEQVKECIYPLQFEGKVITKGDITAVLCKGFMPRSLKIKHLSGDLASAALVGWNIDNQSNTVKFAITPTVVQNKGNHWASTELGSCGSLMVDARDGVGVGIHSRGGSSSNAIAPFTKEYLALLVSKN